MIQYLIMDVDGSITDGKIYMGANGEVMKAFSIKDGYVINYILKPHNIEPVVITARTSSIVQCRCEELHISKVYQGKLDKLKTLREAVGDDSLGSCAYFGDDILDLKCMLPIRDAGGVVGCPADAVQEVKAVSDYICVKKAEEGALREFAEWLITPHYKHDEIQARIEESKKFLQDLNITESDIGKKVIVNNRFSYSVQSYQPATTKELLESHRKNVDIQLIISGKEVMHIADVSRLSLQQEYDADKDVIMWNMPACTADISMQAGDCIVLYPENAHGISANENSNQQVLKLVGKLKI